MTGSREKVSRQRAVTGIVTALILVWLGSVCPSASAAPRGCEGRIAFDSVREEGNRDIYTIVPPPRDAPADAPAPPVTRLTTSLASDAKPSWSPPADACGLPTRPTLLAFQRTSGGSTDIWTFNVTVGTESIEPLIDNGAAPAWAPFDVPVAPESLEPSFPYPPIAFEREGQNGKRDIFVANHDGSEESNLTQTPNVDEANPDWASERPSARAHLAFDSDASGRREVWVMDIRYEPPSGGDPGAYQQLATRQVTAGDAGYSVTPSWFAFTDPETPGFIDRFIDLIAFAGPDQDGANSHIHYVESDRTAPFPPRDTYSLTSSPDEHAAPAWSPFCQELQGERICRMAYQRSDPGGDTEIYLMDPFLDEETDMMDLNVTKFPGGDDKNPDWEAAGLNSVETFHVPRPRGRRSRRRTRIATVVVEQEPRQPQPRPPNAPPLRRPPRSQCTETGTAGSDLLCGTPERDILRGKGGDDRILGRGGNDLLLGGAGEDRILGGPGRDKISGGAGDDRLDGGPGRDALDGGPGRDRLKARDRQRDRVAGGRGRDQAIVDGRLDLVSGVEGRG